MSASGGGGGSGGASSKSQPRALYVGGLDESVTQALLQAAFVPFGELLEVQLPLDVTTGKARGFGFVQFAEESDAADALANMHHAELCGRVIKVNAAKPMKNKSVWADADEWYARLKADGDFDEDGGAAEAAAAGGAAAAPPASPAGGLAAAAADEGEAQAPPR
jgi:peptidyl-prolyl isomerase E (cyclophilin E)